MKMLLAGTPTDCTPATISRMISGEEQHAGAPEGLILIPTMSAGPMNLAQAAGSELSLVSSFMPRSIRQLQSVKSIAQATLRFRRFQACIPLLSLAHDMSGRISK